jgi:hypothetical protein
MRVLDYKKWEKVERGINNGNRLSKDLAGYILPNFKDQFL